MGEIFTSWGNMARQPFKPFKPGNTGAKSSVGGKGSKNEMLPSRHALATLTGGTPAQRTIGNYGKLTPMGAGAPGRWQDIQAMGEAFKDKFK
jgi:hypothetical protein